MIVFLLFAVIFLILSLSEMLWRGKILRGEAGRKFVHIAVGAFVAAWPLFVGSTVIVLMSLALFAVVYISKRYVIFHGIHGVRRKTWGELMFPVGIAMAAVLSPTDWIFSAAILHLSLADGFAAVAGERYGKSNRYQLFGENRSVVGTSVFLLISWAVAFGLVILNPLDFAHAALPILTLLPVLATVVENLAVKGLDNVFVPLSVVLLLGVL